MSNEFKDSLVLVLNDILNSDTVSYKVEYPLDDIKVTLKTGGMEYTFYIPYSVLYYYHNDYPNLRLIVLKYVKLFLTSMILNSCIKEEK